MGQTLKHFTRNQKSWIRCTKTQKALKTDNYNTINLTVTHWKVNWAYVVIYLRGYNLTLSEKKNFFCDEGWLKQDFTFLFLFLRGDDRWKMKKYKLGIKKKQKTKLWKEISFSVVGCIIQVMCWEIRRERNNFISSYAWRWKLIFTKALLKGVITCPFILWNSWRIVII